MAVAQKIPNFLNSMSGMFSSSWQVSVVKQFGTDSYEGFYNKMLLLFICSYTVIGVTLIGFCNILISILADEKFYDAHFIYTSINQFCSIWCTVSIGLRPTLQHQKQSKFYFYSTIWGASVSLIANYLLIPQFMIWGEQSVLSSWHKSPSLPYDYTMQTELYSIGTYRLSAL